MPRPLINRHLARQIYLATAAEWGRPVSRPPRGFLRELEKTLLLKIAAEAAHPQNAKPTTHEKRDQPNRLR